MEPQRPIAVMQQVDHAPPGLLAEFLSAWGIPWALCRAGEGQALPAIGEISGAIVLGGPMSANDNLPFLADELRFLEQAAAQDVPVLGICLGGQLLAKALGAEVRRNAQPEIGYLPIWPTGAAAADLVLGHIREGEIVPQWHSDTFALPLGARQLAYSLACENQAFQLGRSYGLQFHPEITRAIFDRWLAMDEACGEMREVRGQVPVEPEVTSGHRLAAGILRGWLKLINF